jgi:hypothetical protein
VDITGNEEEIKTFFSSDAEIGNREILPIEFRDSACNRTPVAWTPDLRKGTQPVRKKFHESADLGVPSPSSRIVRPEYRIPERDPYGSKSEPSGSDALGVGMSAKCEAVVTLVIYGGVTPGAKVSA